MVPVTVRDLLVIHIELFVVDEGAAGELVGEPAHELAGLGLLDVDEDTLGQDQGGPAEGDLALAQLPLQAGQVGEVGGHQVVSG